MTTNVIINQPIVIGVQSNQWSTGICDCFDDLGICCFAYWCFPCFECNTSSEFGECLCLPLLDISCYTCGQVCIPPISISMRVAVRNRYGIQGSIASDCMYVTCCNTCSWCQMAREIKRRRMGVQQYAVTTQTGVVSSHSVIAM